MLSRPTSLTFLLGLIVLGGAILRVAPVIGSEFPLNDGGLFLTMARDLAGNGLMLPEWTTYNDLGAPFAYPPGGFYLIALLEAMGLSGLLVLLWVPAIVSVATIPVVFGIGQTIFRSGAMGLATAAFFAVSTGAYEWLVLGGGITRAPGFLLALLGVLFAVKAYRGRGWRWPLAAGLALGATGLWHPQAVAFAALSTVLLLPFVADSWRAGLRRLVAIGVIGGVVVMPWLVLLLTRHGFEPLVSAVSSGGTPLVGLVTVLASRTSAGHLEVLGIATTFGLAISALRGFWLPVAWMVAIAVVDSRAGQPYVSLPAALAVAFALRDAGSVLDRQLCRAGRASDGRAQPWSRAPIIVGIVLLAAAFADSLLAQTTPDSPLRAVPQAERQAMAWVATNTEPESAFIVVSGHYWAMDAAAEWFPVLAERRSLATVQGYEWLGAAEYERQSQRAGELAPCVAQADLACIELWLNGAGEADYLYLTRSPDAAAAGLECCHALTEYVARIRPSEVIYRDEAVVIVRLGDETDEVARGSLVDRRPALTIRLLPDRS